MSSHPMDVPSARDEADLMSWMAAYQAGSLEAFDRLHDALAPDLRAYLLGLARDAARADDLLQETFLHVHRARASHIPGRPVRPWIFAIARRVFLMYRRGSTRRARHEVLPAVELPDAPASGTGAGHFDLREDLARALRQVPAGQRRVFLLHHVRGFPFAEIAGALGIRTGAAKIRSSRAASAMRAFLKGTRDD